MRPIQELFDQQKRSLEYFFQSVNMSEMEEIRSVLKGCSGSVIFSGVGKSGLIAQKIAATFVSTGTAARFLSPADALHGDIGHVGGSDVFVALSKSGETEELIGLIPHIEKRGAQTIAVVSQSGSRLERICRIAVHLPVLRELCPFDLAPTTSTEVQLIFGDILAVAMMHERKFTIADFAANHPAGLLGRKITMRVADLMLKGEQLPLCAPSDKLIDVLHELSAKRCGCLLVVDERKKLRGIFTDGDLRRSIQARGSQALHVSLGELMTLSPRSVSQGKLALEAMQLMESDPTRLVTVLPVVEEDQLVGIIRMHDILQP